MLYKFSVGDRVILAVDRASYNFRPGIYTITRVLPLSNDGIQYRAKNAVDNHERVLDQGQIQLLTT